MAENYMAKIQAQNRIIIPNLYMETLKLKVGDKVRINIEKIEKVK